jgi:hypothetical protein
MVDDRAESRRTFVYPEPRADGWRAQNWQADTWRTWLGDRLADWFAPGRERHDAPDDGEPREGWLSAHRLPLAMTAIWLGGLGIYAAGYAGRMGDPGAAGRAFPALDLLFFAFAAIGPVAMLWMVWLLQARAARLTEAVGAQSESALAVAATLANLHDAVESLAENTTARLADASARVERQSGATMARVDRATGEMSERLEAALLETMGKLDESLRARAARFEKSLDTQRDALARRLDDEAERLSRTVEAETQNLASVQETLADRIAAGFAENGARFDRQADELLGSLQGRLDAVGERAEQALAAAAAELSAAQAARHRDLDEGFARKKTALTHTLETASRIVEGEVVPLISGLSDALAETRQSVAAHPPATAAELAGLLGDAAEERIRPERVALDDAVGRITALEDLARKMLAEIDRTSRLNPLMEPAAPAPAAAGVAPAELPFAVLPRAESRAALDWTAVIRALSGESPGETRRHAIERAAADPDVAALIELTRGVAAALAEDGLYLSDVSPVHSPAELWARFAAGERGGEIAGLAGIEDEVALAIARSRLREDAGFRRLAIRLVAAYARLIERAAAEIGADPRLVEIAETRPGRAFLLLAGLLHAFRPVSRVIEA